MLRKLLLLSALGVLAAPGVASAGQRSGIVVKVNPRTGLVAVANARGAVTLAHTSARLRVGQAIRFDARKLRNGTVAATQVRVTGKKARLHVRGVVLAAGKARGTFAISARGAVLVLRSKLRRLASSGATDPAPGSITDVTVNVNANGTLDAVGAKQVDPSAKAAEIDGRVTAVGNGSITVSDNGVSLTLVAPATIDLSKYQVGGQVLAYYSTQPDGSLLLSAVGSDGNETEADDAAEVEGDVAAAETEVEAEDGGGDDEAAGD